MNVVIICILSLIGAAAALFLLFVFTVILASLAVNTNKEYDKDSRFYRWLLDVAVFFALKVSRVKIEAEGLDMIPEDNAFLLVGNHRSNFDPVVMMYILRKKRVGFLSKKEIFNIPFYGRILKKCSCVAIDREDAKNAIKTINGVAERISKDDVPFCVYPEGTRSKSAELLPFHDGVFRVAQKANVPIVVIATDGSEKIAKNFPLHSSHVSFKVCDVISAEEVKSLRTSAIGERVKKKLNFVLENKIVDKSL